ncbi:MAG: 3'-5' exonuclease, partial [Catenibacillus sp.]|nr:3'-5' exonuclease [Catenibacillus sp.]
EQNYRSTKTILNAANDVIHNNSERKVKKLWTSNDEGEKIAFQQYNSELEEAEGIVTEIKAMTESGQADYKDCAVLYRTNAQSRALEERFVVKGVPYRIFGGQNFYQRKEIKDLLAYLKTVDNGSDDLAVRRIINVPKRGIGITSINKVSDYAAANGMGFFEACKEAADIAGLGRSADKIKDFADAILVYKSKLEYLGVSGVMDEIIENTGYIKELEAEDTPEAQSRIENIDEFKNKIAEFEAENPEGTLTEFLAEVSLVADIDNMDESDDKVVLMTLHSAKGLEFPYVYMGGMEDGLFPSYMSIVSDDDTAVEEERRLCYVGITRAMKRLKLTCAKTRMVQGQMQYNKVSRFIKEISRDLIEVKGVIEKEKQTEHFSNFASNVKPYTANGSAFSNPYGNPFGNGGSVSASGFRQATQINNPGRKTDLNTLLGQGKIMRGSDLFDKKSVDTQTSRYAGTAYGTRSLASEKIALDYVVGDTVRHIKFGIGTVVDIKDGGKDYEVTVDFEKCGVKKMFASFAKLKLV